MKNGKQKNRPPGLLEGENTYLYKKIAHSMVQTTENQLPLCQMLPCLNGGLRFEGWLGRHKIFMYIQNLSNKQMKKTYQMPTIELEELVVENGIAQSLGQSYIEDWTEEGGVEI